MARGMGNMGMGNMNMGNMMKQMKQMQKKMAEEQQALNSQTFVGESPEELVRATFSGDRRLTDVDIDPKAIDPDDPDMLNDLVMAAVNDGLAKVEKATQDTMGKYTSGLGL
ncbi:YbaB/EbfC family nucleoid-associated protein [Secundilactobacillus kimchicus]|nr:YbaB/EbfC family nucleoid-associated protein [Secundilactobacillus kimchicus]